MAEESTLALSRVFRRTLTVYSWLATSSIVLGRLMGDDASVLSMKQSVLSTDYFSTQGTASASRWVVCATWIFGGGCSSWNGVTGWSSLLFDDFEEEEASTFELEGWAPSTADLEEGGALNETLLALLGARLSCGECSTMADRSQRVRAYPGIHLRQLQSLFLTSLVRPSGANASIEIQID